MPVNEKPTAVWTRRDDEIAAALYRCVRTSGQLLAASEAFTTLPFASLRRVQARLLAMQHQGWVTQRRYRRSIEQGNSFYYQLTLAGFRQWRQEPRAKPPTRRFFGEIAEVGHHHQYDLARFWTATEQFAAAAGYTIGPVQPVGSFSLTDGQAVMEHDGLLPLVSQSGRVYWIFIELDRSTERLTSSRDDVRHWQKILRIYDHVQNYLPKGERFRVWSVCTRSRQRAEHIAKLFGTLTGNVNRQLLLSFSLADYELSPNGLTYPLAWEHRRDRQTLLPRGGHMLPPQRQSNLLASLLPAA